MSEDSIKDQLTRFADVFNSIEKSEDAEVRYEIFADAVYWTDELPRRRDTDPSDYWCLRPILRYRTSLILGTPDEKWMCLWEEAKRLFPNWPGFEPERQQPSETLSDYYHSARVDASRRMDDMFDD